MQKGLLVAGLSGGSGKSVVAVGLCAAYAKQGLVVAPFKKGPDYIDAGWLALAAGRSCYNLDPFLMTWQALQDSFAEHCQKTELAIVEGNRGLYDGVDVAGSACSAELAVVLNLPVLLVVDCTKTTRTVAALVLGCREMDHRVKFAGVVLNRVAGSRHEQIVRQSVEHYTGIPVLGAIPKAAEDVFPQRHLGLTPCPEHASAAEAVACLAERASACLDLSGIMAMMSELPGSYEKPAEIRGEESRLPVRIGIIRDAAFQFYYSENIEALTRLGAELVTINAMTDTRLPDGLAGLYIGGGFPETNAPALAGNTPFKEALRNAVEDGLPVYAECGGLIYLGESMVLNGEIFPLVGVFPVVFGLDRKPQAHGYSVLETRAPNPFYEVGTEIKGHEFRYSRVLKYDGDPDGLIFAVKRGVGFIERRDGLVYKSVLALYTHVHALGTPEWAKGLVAGARNFRKVQ